MFFEGNVLGGHLFKFALEAAQLVLLLKATLQGTLAVLQKPSLLLGKIGGGDALFDRGKLPLSGVLRRISTLVSVGEVRDAIKVLVLLISKVCGGGLAVRRSLATLGIFRFPEVIARDSIARILVAYLALFHASVLGTDCFVLPANIFSLGADDSTVLLRHAAHLLVDGQIQIVLARKFGNVAADVRRKINVAALVLLGGTLHLLTVRILLDSVGSRVPVLLGAGSSLLVGALLAALCQDLLQY